MSPENREAAEYVPAAPELERAAQMDARTLEALNGAIAKWERMASDDYDDAAEAREIHCPLCALFNPEFFTSANDCVGCPVFASTKQLYCKGTPYTRYARARDEDQHDEILQECAAEELDFLKSLLPVTP